LVKPVLLNSKLNLSKFIKRTAKTLGWKKLGYEKTDLKVSELENLSKKLPLKLVGTQNLIEKLREVKSNEEVSVITKAAQITDQVFQKILPKLKAGLREQEVEAKIRTESAKLGASGQSFAPIVAAGKHSSIPHHLTSNYRLRLGDVVLIDFGAKWSGYCSDMTRTVFLKKPTSKQKEVYDLVLKAQEVAIKGIKPGMTGAQADKFARKIIERAGFGENFLHSLGHGVGIEVHDGLRLVPKNKVVLRPGMVFTIEPGVYLPGKFGVRIEDLVVMKDDGVKVLSKSPKDLLVLN
jgi:Xaa-Pro aminopeptidase